MLSLRYGKTDNKKRAIHLVLQHYSDVAGFLRGW